ncbi:MAG TPA: hypothetical protein VHU80_22275 [Polyangiaceae bacterium]|jgi:hypothetical protein|nr:hypothetical protein [Polyangiaceae bacterium]
MVAAAATILLSLGEVRILDRLLFVDRREFGFVLDSVHAIVARAPIWRSWQHRLIPAYALNGLEALTTTPLEALRFFTEAMILVQNVFLFALVKRLGATTGVALGAALLFVLARVLLTYELEYPWDEIDICLFSAFGYIVTRERPFVRSIPLLVVGLFNHETVLYLPLWFVLSGAERPRPPNGRRDFFQGALTFALLAAAIAGVRLMLYGGTPAPSGRVFERETPLVANPIHFAHNARQLFFADWRDERVFVSLSFLYVLTMMATLVVRRKHVRAAWWTSSFLMAVFTFGYVNETRLYLPLLAFWCVYGAASVIAHRRNTFALAVEN